MCVWSVTRVVSGQQTALARPLLRRQAAASSGPFAVPHPLLRLTPLTALPCTSSPIQLRRRHLRRLLVELLEVAKASKGKQAFDLDLSPVGEDFDPLAIA